MIPFSSPGTGSADAIVADQKKTKASKKCTCMPLGGSWRCPSKMDENSDLPEIKAHGGSVVKSVTGSVDDFLLGELHSACKHSAHAD